MKVATSPTSVMEYRPQDPEKILADGRAMARALLGAYSPEKALPMARVLVQRAIATFWGSLAPELPLRDPLASVNLENPPEDIIPIAETQGHIAAGLGIERGFYEIGLFYTALLPSEFRALHGVYYTPPGLTQLLLDRAHSAGTDWRTARVVDPACGGGAFLAPVAQRMARALSDHGPGEILAEIGNRLRGFEIDPFSAWISQVALDIVLLPHSQAFGEVPPQVVEIRDTLWDPLPEDSFDLVVGNPPYGRIRLSREQRKSYARSLYGHANLYGLFTDAALRLSRRGGVIGFVTPTSFLTGGYFRKLRSLLAGEAPPRTLDLLSAREGVFADVLQETLLATYRRGEASSTCEVSLLEAAGPEKAVPHPVGEIHLPWEPSEPWPVPRTPEQAELVSTMESQPCRLADWGYTVSTGPLVWNRKKDQLTEKPTRDTYPLIWAEAVTSHGEFVFQARKRNHKPYFRIRAGDEWLLVTRRCVLLQRTTSKEQNRRLLATPIPQGFLEQHGAVVVENHLNMVRPQGDHPKVSPETVSAFLNSRLADWVFRCLNGSVAVSAYELEAMPLPSPDALQRVEAALQRGENPEAVEVACREAYGLREEGAPVG